MNRCGICGNVFSQRWILMRHVRTVHGEPHHRCALCDETFTRIENYNAHIKRQEGCPHCHHICCGKRALSRHIKVVHGENPTTPVIQEWERIPDQARMLQSQNSPIERDEDLWEEIPDEIFLAADANTG